MKFPDWNYHWQVADINRDGSLDRAEFSAFVHPEVNYQQEPKLSKGVELEQANHQLIF